MAKGIKFDINEVGSERIAAALQDPALVGVPLVEMFESAGSLAKKTAVEGLDGGKGLAVRTIAFTVRPLQMRTVTMLPRARALSIEKGRPAGGPKVSLPQIINWKNAVGHPDFAVVIARGIQQRGVRGRFFMRAAQEAVRNALPGFVADMVRKIEERWGRNVS